MNKQRPDSSPVSPSHDVASVRFLVNDRVKLIAYRVFDPTAAPLLGRSSSPVVARLRFVSNPSAVGR